MNASNAWGIWKLSHAFDRIGSGTTPTSNDVSYYADAGGTPWITTSELRENYIFSTQHQVSKEALEDFSALRVYRPGSLMIAMYGATIGRLGMTKIEATCNQACCVFEVSEQFSNRFLFYWLWHRRSDLIALSVGGGQPNLSQQDLKEERALCPPLHTQRRIAQFLDEKIIRIDALIEKKRELLDRLAEKRQALITRAVTKGLDPDVPMKSSGIEWIGEIPGHWEVLPIRRITTRVATGRTPPSTSTDYFTNGKVNWFTPGDFVASIELHNSTRKIIPEAIEDGVCIFFPAGTVFLVGIGATLGKVAVSTTPGSANQQINAILTDRNNDPYFVAYFLHSFKTEVRVLSNGNTLGILNQDGTKSLLVPVPPHQEQTVIASELRNYDMKEVDVIKQIKESMKLLHDYRSALITSAVTGQLTELL